MKSLLYYRIAEHLIAIATPDIERTAQLLPNFAPFRSERGNGEEILLQIEGGVAIDLANAKSLDIFEWNSFSYKVSKEGDTIFVTMERGGRCHFLKASADWRVLQTDLTMLAKYEWQFLNNFIIVAFGMSSAPFSTIKMHASVTELNGKALLFLGRSGTGKSTHSNLWREFVPGSTLLNDDEPVVRICKDGVIRVFGTPWSGKTPCYKNISAEVAAFVHLFQHPENKLTQINGAEAFKSIFSSSSVMRAIPENKDSVFDTVADILQYIPVYRLDCRPDREAVSLTQSLI